MTIDITDELRAFADGCERVSRVSVDGGDREAALVLRTVLREAATEIERLREIEWMYHSLD